MKRMMMAAAVLLLAVGCSEQGDPPTPNQTVDNAEFFEMPRPDGSTMMCVQYGAEGSYKSWYSFTCDWSGEYDG